MNRGSATNLQNARELENLRDNNEALRKESSELKKNIDHLLAQVGGKAKCRGCGADIWWVKHNNGKNVPYTATGLNHFIDCGHADRFRKRREQ